MAAPVERAVKQITLLMPVWGRQFTGRFLEFCLPTLLAPNNIPAIARTLPCHFVVLSSQADEPIIRSHPAWQKLERLCTADIRSIDDLITQGNHTATITLAFERALRQSEDAMRDTCFIFLMSDYLMADGSLAAVLHTIQSGASAVLTGNFQITAEDATLQLRKQTNVAANQLVLTSRELLQWSLAHLHPATVANIVNFGLTHNDHTNRLFWRVDENCLIGRFYLMHPIAIHPEKNDFVVSASWDYSFVPELCPSGNVVTLTDSDDYLVVELQRREYEWENLRLGPLVPAALARSLAEWTTEAHRRNVAQTVVFHAAERPANLAQVMAQADAFVERVSRALTAPSLAHRRHPYWVGSIATNRYRAHRPLGKDDWSFLLSDRAIQPNPLLHRLQQAFFGFPPDVTGLHPLWPDYRLPLRTVNRILAAGGQVLLVAHDCEPFAQWVTGATGDVATLNTEHLLELPRSQYDALADTFDACLLLLGNAKLEQMDELIEHIGPLLKPNGQIVLVAINSISAKDATEFSGNFAKQAGRLWNRTAQPKDIRYIELSPWRHALRNATLQVSSKTGVARLLLAVAGSPILLFNYFANLATHSSATPPRSSWSSVCVTLPVSGRPVPYPHRLARDPVFDLVRGDRLVDLMEPALQTGRLWWQLDTAQLASHLARYQFVVAMMGARHDVAEYGCANPLGTHLAAQRFRKLTLFDPRPSVVDDLQRRLQVSRRFDARDHDVLAAPLPKKVDSIYCIDFMQYVSRDEENEFIRNLRDSLLHDFDFLLLGSPSYTVRIVGAPDHVAMSDPPDAQTSTRQLTPEHGLSGVDMPKFAVDHSKIYRRTGAELEAAMTQFFHNVFMFSMTEDVVQPGIQDNAHHFFALGCGRKA